MPGTNISDPNGNKVVWWLLTIFSGLIVSGVFWMGSRNERLRDIVQEQQTRIVAQEIKEIGLEARLNSLERFVEMVRNEQVERTAKFGELNNSNRALDDRVKNLSERVNLLVDQIRANHTMTKP